ncbi:MAG: sulfotransferase [Rhodothermales bacterium]|nr:sulfotransferase [Rhodothermales bacterium]
MKSPIFIVGANRSGTTLLRLILNAHPNLAIPEEVVYFGSSLAGVSIDRWRDPGLTKEAYTSFVMQFLDNNCQPLGDIDRDELLDTILEEGPADFRRPYQCVLESWAARQRKIRWGEKTPGNLFYADIIYEMFPDARFIHLVRDPRAGVSSMLGTSFFPNDVVFNALGRAKFMTEGRALLERHVPAEQRFLLRYEDIVASPEPTIRALCDFLGEAFEPAMMDFHEGASKFMKKEAAMDFNAAATRPISADMRDKWRAKLDTADIAKIQAVCRRVMADYGYELEPATLGLTDRLEVWIKQLYWRYQTYRNRHVRHYTVKSMMFARVRGRMRKKLGGLQKQSGPA